MCTVSSIVLLLTLIGHDMVLISIIISLTLQLHNVQYLSRGLKVQPVLNFDVLDSLGVFAIHLNTGQSKYWMDRILNLTGFRGFGIQILTV